MEKDYKYKNYSWGETENVILALAHPLLVS
jgi:hypothetical protein